MRIRPSAGSNPARPSKENQKVKQKTSKATVIGVALGYLIIACAGLGLVGLLALIVRWVVGVFA